MRWVAPLLLAGCVETSLSYRQLPPSAEVIWPADGAHVVAEADVELVGRAADAEDPIAQLRTRWFVDAAEVCPDTAPERDGTTTCTVRLSPGQPQITLEVEDSAGAVTSTSIGLSAELNRPPLVLISSPEPGSTIDPGSAFLNGVVSDPEDAPTELEVWWTSSLDPDLHVEATAGADGTVSGQAALIEGPHLLWLHARDTHGAEGSAVVDVFAARSNLPPDVHLLVPADGAQLHASVPTALLAAATDPDDAREDLWATWSSDVQGTVSEGPVAADGAANTGLIALDAGTHTLQVEVQDPGGATAQASVTVHVNGVPEPPEISITPAAPTSVDDLGVRIDVPAVDPNGDAITLEAEWSVDSDAAFSFSGAPLPAGTARRGEQWTVQVLAWDAFGPSAPATASVVIANAAPTATPALEPAHAATDTVLVVLSDTSDPDADIVSVDVAWTVNGSAVPVTEAALDGALYFDSGDTVTATVTPFDGLDHGPPASASVVVADSPPDRPEIAVVPGCPAAGQAAVCSVVAPALDPDGDPVTYAFAWEKDGVPFAGAGTTVWAGDTLPAADATAGSVWTCTVTASAAGVPSGAVGVTATVGGTADGDGDGWASSECSGRDCDDADPGVHPEATRAADRCLPFQPLHLWSGDGDATDSVGAADGTPGTATAWVPGLTGLAFAIDGSVDAAVSLPVNVSPMRIPQLTMGMWARLDAPPQEVAVGLSQEDGAGWDRSLVFWDPRYGTGISGGTGELPYVSTVPGPAESIATWMCVAAVYDAATNQLTMYSDGATQQVYARPGPGLSELWLGVNPGFRPGTIGALDEVFLFDRLLDMQDLDELCAALGPLP